ncbi:NAD(P)-dependent alcohol dehydrogenase [Promicromonospora sukumoe]|uniref:Aryl-alcohol dehydrogenase n=1 Tax=Promicromonospora sukumoe TaxID=88382 RepID=A0A7W3PDK4_9MICO|nr:NAD(P)-dependent alcohol dehydrogenase [Promicromonospora sukumoe]MBA8807642.1 aryl-alcohol dehydrogenase [Promicromonospora sukumoe]
MTATHAAVMRDVKTISLEDLDVGPIRDDEVLVRIESAGICATDIEILDEGFDQLATPPVVLGHEGAGVVEQVGRAVTGLEPGDKVLLTSANCGHCRACVSGKPAYCEHHYDINFSGGRSDGSTSLTDQSGQPVHSHFFYQSSWSTYAVAHATSTIKVSPDVDPAVLGPFGCGVRTGAGSVLDVLQVTPGSSIAVFGLGAVGLTAIMAAKVAGASTIIAVARKKPQLDRALEVGATHVIDTTSTDDVPAAVRAIVGGTGVDFSLEATGNAGVMRTSVEVLGEMGHAVITGVAQGQALEFDPWLLLGGRKVSGSTLGDSAPSILLPRLVDLYLQGRFPIDKIETHYPLDDIDKALADSRSGRVAKAVLHPATGPNGSDRPEG